MRDPRVRKLAELVVNYSVKVQKGDKVLIRKDGLFIIDELKGLNPEELKKTLEL